MDRLPNWLKWLVVALVFAVLAVMVLAVDRRPPGGDVPHPHTPLGIPRDPARAPPCPPSHKARPPVHGRGLLRLGSPLSVSPHCPACPDGVFCANCS